MGKCSCPWPENIFIVSDHDKITQLIHKGKMAHHIYGLPKMDTRKKS